MQLAIHTNSINAWVVLPERPLLVHNVSRLTGLCKSAIRWNAKHGFLKGFKDPDTPKIWRFWRADVEAFMRAKEPPCIH